MAGAVTRLLTLLLVVSSVHACVNRPPPPQKKQQQRGPLDDPRLISCLYERTGEPIFLIRRINNEETVLFQFPKSYLPALYSNYSGSTRLAEATRVITVPEIEIPDLSLPERLGPNEGFSTFIPYHRSMAARLIQVLVETKSYADFMTTVLYCRARMNPQLVNYALSVVILHRNDTKSIDLPNFACVTPDRFVGGRGVFGELRQRSAVFNDEERASVPFVIPKDFTGTDMDPEHKVAYLREDIGINLNHWSWHLVNPSQGPPSVVNKDRRGELFYYFHQQFVARYDFERLTNELPRVKKYSNWKEPVEEAYFPKLDHILGSRVWPARPSNAYLRDLARPGDQLYLDVEDLERWYDRIVNAIHSRRIQNGDNEYISLDEETGTDMLGNIIEASSLSPNPGYYGNLHNAGHIMIALVHDPDQRYLESYGVMGELATAVRDPIFFRWHKFIDQLFQDHKESLSRHTSEQLGFEGVSIAEVGVQTEKQPFQPNLLETFWEMSDMDLSRGLDFGPSGPVYVRLTHLQHELFKYIIRVQNSGSEQNCTVRIFLAPKQDERKYDMNLQPQRLLFMEMDKFQYTLTPGENIIERYSNESAVTVPPERTFRNLVTNTPQGFFAQEQYNFCGCGWPQHMLVPKGTPEGYPAQLFVMISKDSLNFGNAKMCLRGWTTCGIRGQRYPDKRPMGFPFDRPLRAETVESFASRYDNMAVIDMLIQHQERTVMGPFANTT